jgi:hypoxanthine phosphoribosyltransferase
VKVLVTGEDIFNHVCLTSYLIKKDYENKPFTALVVLKGAVPFATDLLLCVSDSVQCEIEYISVNSYGDTDISFGSVETEDFVFSKFKDKPILIIDDIIDTGKTINHLINEISQYTSDIRACCLLSKPSRRQISEDILDYSAIEIPDVFVYGYGMDKKGLYRNYPEICYDE